MSDLEDSKMPLLDHLIELRRRLLWSFVALAISFAICLYFARPILSFLVAPLEAAGQAKIINTQLFGAFIVEIKVALFAALMIAFPVFATQAWKFIAPGLYRNEKNAFLPFLIMTPVLFTLGAAMAYYVAMPTAFRFALSFQGDLGGVQQEALPDVLDYLGVVMLFIFGFGAAFLLPVALMLLERVGILTLEQLQSGRRYAIVGMAVVSAVLTPPDLFSQILLLVPLCLLYEFAIIAIRITRNRKAKADAQAEESSSAS
jgi:sec-independent protein translocase protein TatC